MVSEAGIKPLPKHVAAIQEFPVPTTIKQLQQFLGMINFYRRFLPKIAATLPPLTDLLRGNPKSLDWSAPAAEAFEAAKSALVRAVPLTQPAPGATLSLAVDASDSHVGGVLQQLENRAWRPLAFFHKNSHQHRSGTPHLIVNCWPHTPLSATSVSSLKVAGSGS
jgi:hypothetical protein